MLLTRSRSATAGAAVFALLAGIGLTSPEAARAQSAADSAAIRATALDYIDGFYSGDAERMERALHPDLAKRIVQRRPGQPEAVQAMSADDLVGITARGGGTGMPDQMKRSDVTILDIYEGMASVKIVAGTWVDYLHVGRIDGEWKIINVLWEMIPQG